jgi:hypothetical protein
MAHPDYLAMLKTSPSLPVLVDRLYRYHINERDRVLLDTVFAPVPTQAMLDRCLEICDIEVLGAHKSLMFSYLMYDHPELCFSPYADPRVRNLLDHFRFKNMEVLSHFSRIGKALNDAGIPVLLFKGAVMRALRPELSRPMGDVDFLVPGECFSRAFSICKALGYRDAKTGASHSVDLLESGGKQVADLHKRIFEGANSPSYYKALFNRSRECTVFGVKTLIPCREDMFSITLLNLEKNLREKSSLHSLYFSLFDCRFFLAEAGFDWRIVRKNVRVLESEFQARCAVEFMNALTSGIIPDMEKHFPLDKKVQDGFNRFALEKTILAEKRAACHRILAIDIKRHPRYYGRMILKMILFRRLLAFPPLVRWYRRRQFAGAENED